MIGCLLSIQHRILHSLSPIVHSQILLERKTGVRFPQNDYLEDMSIFPFFNNLTILWMTQVSDGTVRVYFCSVRKRVVECLIIKLREVMDRKSEAVGTTLYFEYIDQLQVNFCLLARQQIS